MISLPSGRSAGITSIRARYHALRLNQSVTAETPHHALYRLIDIVEGRTERSWLPGDPAYQFSGKTLDDLPGLANWPAADRHAFVAWLRRDTQVREIEAARRRLVQDELPLAVREFDYPSQLYSALAKRIEGHSLRRASPRQWRQTLINMRRSGMRLEELEWSGLLAYLSNAERAGEGTISRERLLAQVDFSPIRLSLTNELATDKGGALDFIEVKQSKSLNRLGAAGRVAGTDQLSVLRYVDTLHYYKVGYLKRRQTGLHGPQQWFALDTVGNLIPASAEQAYFDDKEAAFNAASEHALQHVGVPVAYTRCSRYEHKTLCGGDDYREWLLTLPDYPISYYNKHYYERNLLLHFRTKQRQDLQGRRLLFVEEIQSDWHQAGAVKGYQNRWPGQLPPAPFTKEWLALALKLILLHAAREGYEGMAWTRGRIQESHYLQSLAPVRRLYDDAIPKALQRLVRTIDGAALQTTRIATKEPRLHISRQFDKWLITDPKGSFMTRPRRSQQEAMQIKARHCRQIELEVQMLALNETARNQITERGFPRFGESGFDG
jgi:hypothetical protein